MLPQHFEVRMLHPNRFV